MVDGDASPRVVLDAMGGDNAPSVTVQGAVRAVRDHGIDVVLVGDAARLRQLAGASDLPVVDAPDVVDMDEDPAIGLRAKPDASVRVAARLVASGAADVLVSAGSTGATLAAALLEIGRVPGVRRPVVAVLLPVRGGGRVVLADAGGSADVQPAALVGYARLALAYAGSLGAERPRVGLLNVGVEPGKGNAFTRAAYLALADSEGFAGNVEPVAVLDGAVDAVVADGFTGNVFLKAVEAGAAATRVADSGDHQPLEQHAAGVLLGVRRDVLVAHGAAGAAVVTAALRQASAVAASGLANHIAGRLAVAGARP